ncbi:hypothetical protein D3C78_614710 [compost metagenome]
MNKSAFLQLSRKLSFDIEATVLEDVTLAVDQPTEYFEKYEERLEERGIDEPYEGMAWIALVDVLLENDLAFEIDWKETGIYVCDVVDELIHRKKLPTFDWEKYEDEEYNEMPSDQFLNEIANELRKVNLTLAHLDIDSDCYVLIVVPAAEWDEIKRWSEEAGVTVSNRFH